METMYKIGFGMLFTALVVPLVVFAIFGIRHYGCCNNSRREVSSYSQQRSTSPPPESHSDSGDNGIDIEQGGHPPPAHVGSEIPAASAGTRARREARTGDRPNPEAYPDEQAVQNARRLVRPEAHQQAPTEGTPFPVLTGNNSIGLDARDGLHGHRHRIPGQIRQEIRGVRDNYQNYFREIRSQVQSVGSSRQQAQAADEAVPSRTSAQRTSRSLATEERGHPFPILPLGFFPPDDQVAMEGYGEYVSQNRRELQPVSSRSRRPRSSRPQQPVQPRAAEPTEETWRGARLAAAARVNARWASYQHDDGMRNMLPQLQPMHGTVQLPTYQQATSGQPPDYGHVISHGEPFFRRGG